MTYDDYDAISEDLLYALREGAISDEQYENEMEALAEQWEEWGENDRCGGC